MVHIKENNKNTRIQKKCVNKQNMKYWAAIMIHAVKSKQTFMSWPTMLI